MRTLRALVGIARAWLDVRFLRWSRETERPYRVFHGEKPTMPGYRRRRR